MKIGSVLFYICFAALAFSSCISANDKKSEDVYYLVSKVVDGDTFWIDDHTDNGIKVRLIGIDAPETRRVGRKEMGFYGKESKGYLKKLIMNKHVRLEFDVDPVDEYECALAYVFLEDGTFLNAHMIKEGYAQVITESPNLKYSKLFLQLQIESRENHRGLWRNVDEHR